MYKVRVEITWKSEKKKISKLLNQIKPKLKKENIFRIKDEKSKVYVYIITKSKQKKTHLFIILVKIKCQSIRESEQLLLNCSKYKYFLDNGLRHAIANVCS